MSKVEILISSLDKKANELVKTMNIKSPAIVVNQCDYNKTEELLWKDNKIKVMNLSERGVGLSRNTALHRASEYIAAMADDDMVYVDNYQQIILDEYKRKPKADMIVFNVRIHNEDGISEKVTGEKKLYFFNSLKYGTVSFTFKNEVIKRNNVNFSRLFGGGAKYNAGEDCLFMWSCLRSGMNIYTSKKIIADVYNYDSTWFKGYDKKFFEDKGALFRALSKKFSYILIIQYLIRRFPNKKTNITRKEAFKLMVRGAKKFEGRIDEVD